MNMYLVCCDLRNGSKDNSGLCEELNRYNGVRFQPEAWMILSDAPSEAIYNQLSQHLDDSDYILITKVSDDLSCKQTDNIERWIHKNLYK